MKPYTVLTFLVILTLTLIPPGHLIIHNPQYQQWTWMVLAAGFLGILILFLNTDIALKIISLVTFIWCFFSKVPVISFTAYCSIVACFYFYICCTRIESWAFIFKAVQSVVLLNVILLVMDFFKKDTLMMTNQVYWQSYGILGHRMEMASFAVVSAALLVSLSKLNILFPLLVSLVCKSSWAFLATGIGVFVYLLRDNKNLAGIILTVCAAVFALSDLYTHKIESNLNKSNGRLLVWQRSLELTNKFPITGFGPGTFKEVFQPLSGIGSVPWETAHNFIVQFIFEFGYPLAGCLLFGLGYLFWALLKANLWVQASGLAMMFTDGLVHFPERTVQCVPIIIIFLAYVRYSLCRTQILMS